MNPKQIHLDKSLKPINVWSLALGSIIGWGAFVMPGNLFLKTAGPLGTAIGMLIGAIIMIVISISYSFMIQRYPVAGGGFTFAFHGFGRYHAFICGWFLGLSYLSIVPLNATALGLIGRYMFPGILQRGYLYTIAGWDVYLGEALFASVALILFAFISIKGVKVSMWIQTLMALTLVGSIILLFIVSLISPDTQVRNLDPLFSLETIPIQGILMIVAIAPWAYVGFDTIPQAAEEFKFPPKKAFGIMIASILFGAIMYIAMNTVTAVVFPWQEFLASDPFWATGAAVEQLMGTLGLSILGLAIMAAIMTGVIGFYIATSRLLLSMSRAKALPEWFNVIHPKYKTPSNAIKFVLFISLITPWFGRQVLTWVVDMASIGAAIGYFYTCASTFKLLLKERGHLLQRAFSFLGSLLSLGFIILLIVPGMPGYLSFPSRIALIVWIVLGILFYLISGKSYQKLSDKELNRLIMKEEIENKQVI